MKFFFLTFKFDGKWQSCLWRAETEGCCISVVYDKLIGKEDTLKGEYSNVSRTLEIIVTFIFLEKS